MAQLLVVDGWEELGGTPRFEIDGDEDRCILVEPPLLVDDIFRPVGCSSEMHVGQARQTPFQLTADQGSQLLTLLQKQRPKVHAVAALRGGTQGAAPGLKRTRRSPADRTSSPCTGSAVGGKLP